VASASAVASRVDQRAVAPGHDHDVVAVDFEPGVDGGRFQFAAASLEELGDDDRVESEHHDAVDDGRGEGRASRRPRTRS
jgi:hypothetical protein